MPITFDNLHFQLGCNHIGDEGVKAIALALISNAQSSGLIWLALGGNGITDKGAEHLAFALKVQHTPSGPSGRMTDKEGETYHEIIRPLSHSNST